MGGKIAVLGSMNMDLVATVDRAPVTGETITGHSFLQVPGGKGANQAIAASVAGTQVTMPGAVGDDPYGRHIVALLAAKGVDTNAIARVDGPTGTAHIVVDASDPNSIIVIPGANGTFDTLQDHHRAVIERSDVLLLQLELPLSVVAEAAAFAHDRGVRVVLTPAPVRPLHDAVMANVDLLVPNQGRLWPFPGRRPLRRPPHCCRLMQGPS